MRTPSICLALAMFLLCPPASTQWVQTSLDTGSVMCLAVRGTSLTAGTASGGVYLSTNNGTSWTSVNSGVPITNTRVTALAVVETSLFVGTEGSGIYVSTDNGDNWRGASVGLLNGFVSDFAAYGAKLYVATAGGVFVSSNSGTSWDSINTGLSNLFVSSLAFSDTNLFAGMGCFGGVFLSTNYGMSWTPVNSNSGLEKIIVHSLEVYDRNLFALTDCGVFLTTNSGVSWDSANTGLTDRYINCLSSYPDGKGGTSLFAGTLSGIFLSTNNGTNWTEISTGLTNRVVWALAVSGTTLFAGTGDGVRRRSLSDFVGAVETSSKLPTVVALVQNYPNPFNPSTTIKYELPKTSVLRLSVYDMLGREVWVLVNGRKTAGVHEVRFDGSNLASGVYFYRLQTGEFVQSRQLVLLR